MSLRCQRLKFVVFVGERPGSVRSTEFLTYSRKHQPHTHQDYTVKRRKCQLFEKESHLGFTTSILMRLQNIMSIGFV